MDTLTTNTEIVDAALPISGGDVVQDLLDRLAEKLLSSDSLRGTDAYQSYSACVTVTLQLVDVYPVEVAAEVQVGTIDPQRPAKTMAFALPNVQAEEVRERSGLPPANLEYSIHDNAAVPAPTPKKRYYTPTGRSRGRPRKFSLQGSLGS